LSHVKKHIDWLSLKMKRREGIRNWDFVPEILTECLWDALLFIVRLYELWNRELRLRERVAYDVGSLSALPAAGVVPLRLTEKHSAHSSVNIRFIS
jgi:hypothetical protein